MIFVDTSVWVAALRSESGPEAKRLGVLLDRGEVALAVVVRLEILGGASSRDRRRLKRVLSALPCVLPGDETWQRIEGWIDASSAKGQRFAVADLLIAATAAETESAVWSLDADFERMARLGLVVLHRPSPAPG